MVKAAKPKRAQSRPRFKRGDRVTWHEGPAACYGTVRECHRLGGHGRAYEVAQDFEALPVEIPEVELSPVAPHEEPTLRNLLIGVHDADPQALPPALAGLREWWLKAKHPGL